MVRIDQTVDAGEKSQQKAILVFYIPGQESELREALNGSRYRTVLWELDRWLSAEIRTGTSNTKRDLFKEVYARLQQTLKFEQVFLGD